ncbi:hypothetical protein DXT66_11360 [Nocardia farcinica]|nr:hypothetical protein DXT66_11360 [Nocardia farcinica]
MRSPRCLLEAVPAGETNGMPPIYRPSGMINAMHRRGAAVHPKRVSSRRLCWISPVRGGLRGDAALPPPAADPLRLCRIRLCGAACVVMLRCRLRPLTAQAGAAVGRGVVSLARTACSTSAKAVRIIAP